MGMALLLVLGCSQQEELDPDNGGSPFLTNPAATKTAAGAGAATDGSAAAGGRSIAAPSVPEEPLRPEDVERQIRIAMRALERGDPGRAGPLLDRILALEPANREALYGRAAVAMEQLQHATQPADRAAVLQRAGSAARALRRTYERPNKRELDLLARVFYEEVRAATDEGQFDRAAQVLREVHDTGFEPLSRIEADPALAKLRESPAYHSLVADLDAADLFKARDRIQDRVDRPTGVTFDFQIKDLGGKPLSLAEYRGKVLLVDVWGTWCKPCQEALPGLVQLYFKHKRRGFDIVGLDYEQNAPDPETARQYVQRFVKESGIPYRIAMLDDDLQDKLPEPHVYPTTLLYDRAGRVRLVLNGGGKEALETLDDAIRVLLAEPADKALTPGPAAASKPEAEKSAPSPPARTDKSVPQNKPAVDRLAPQDKPAAATGAAEKSAATSSEKPTQPASSGTSTPH